MEMSTTEAIRRVLKQSREAAFGNTGVLYAEVCKALHVSDPVMAPNPGSVYRIWRRYRMYGEALWGNRDEQL